MIMKAVKEYMQTQVVTFKPTDTVFEAAKVLSSMSISGAPVVEEGMIVGMVSEADLVRHFKINLPSTQPFEGHTEINIGLMLSDLLRENLQFKSEAVRMTKTQLKDVMSKTVISTTPESGLVEAAELMEKHDVHRLTVIDDGKLVGIISRADLIRALVD